MECDSRPTSTARRTRAVGGRPCSRRRRTTSITGMFATIGCSSTAEWQMGVAALGNPAFSAMIAQGFGAGVGRVGPFYEQGNWYRGGAVQMLFIAWIYGEQNQVRPMFPPT